MSKKQIFTLENLPVLAEELKQSNQKIVLLGGCFDILHIGHISLLESAKKYGATVVLLESDETITKRKGSDRPLHTQMQRAKVLSALKSVDYIILLPAHINNSDYDELTKTLQPAIIATTENDPGIEHKQRQAKLIQAELVFVNKPIQDVSTSRIVSALQKEL